MMLKTLLETIGMEPARLRLEWVSAAEGSKFAEVVDEYCAQVKRLGPSPFGDTVK
jgi:F420-non-reducing hydrogenase iron-sulfur subunit